MGTVAGVLLAAAGEAMPALGRGGDGRGSDVSAATTTKVFVGGLVRDGLQPSSQASFQTVVTARIESGQVVLTGDVTAGQSGEYVVDFEIVAPNGQRVDQQWFDRELFIQGQKRTFTVRWTPPVTGRVPGQYVVKAGVFAPGPLWSLLYHWNDRAATFVLP